MDMTEFLAEEWKPALGCTEPAAVAWAAALAAAQGTGPILLVHLHCDPRTYKNCYAVGIPNAGGATGILWALALGANLPEASKGLRCFEAIDSDSLQAAASLLAAGRVKVEVDPSKDHLMIDVTVIRNQRHGRALLSREHTHLARLEKDGYLVGGRDAEPEALAKNHVRRLVAASTIEDMMALARSLSTADRVRLREGAAMNLEIALEGLSLLPKGFAGSSANTDLMPPTHLVSGGVFARMSGSSNPVMTLAGSGNKGISLTIPILMTGRQTDQPEDRIEEALAFGCLMTSSATWHLGTLSSICGAANAAGIGVASALVFMEGGTAHQVGLAISTMVGTLAGMICDGAKIGCAMKAMTGVDTAYRAASMALADVGIPRTDGIVGFNGPSSLLNLGRIANQGMVGVDSEILRIMQDKLQSRPSGPV
jgi:L-cysteine desulfidase